MIFLSLNERIDYTVDLSVTMNGAWYVPWHRLLLMLCPQQYTILRSLALRLA